MNITFHRVHPALHEFVDVIMSVNRLPDGNGEFFQTSLPNHECYLSFEYETDFVVKKDNATGFAHVHATTIIPPQLGKTDMKGTTMKAIMVKFKNGGFFRLFKIPMPLFHNNCFNARDVLNKEVADLYEGILNAGTVAEKIKRVELFLITKTVDAAPYLPIDHALEQLMASNGNMPIQDIASIACMSIRQLQRKFLDYFGMSPKHYSRLIRFTTACRMRNTSPQLTWGDISMRCGYYDHMHLIKDFKSITEVNPRVLDRQVNSADMILFPDNILLS